MTLNDIGRMIKLAKVPRSKVIHTTYPNPAFVVIVPKTHYFIVANVVGQLKLRTDNVTVKPFDDERIKDGEHQYVKVTGDAERLKRDVQAETHQRYLARRRVLNAAVTVECVSVIS